MANAAVVAGDNSGAAAAAVDGGAVAGGGDAAAAAPPHLSIQGIAKSFGAVRALRGVDLAVRRGEVTGLVGDNGAGKSTLMKIIAGVERADAGRLLLDGAPVQIHSSQAAAAAGIQTVFQDLALCENLDVTANLFLGHEATAGGPGWRFLPRLLRPLRGMDMERDAREAVAKLQVHTLQSVRAKVGLLSGGQRQAVAIARAIRSESTVVLLDEPTAALGVAQTAQVLDIVRSLRRGHAVLYVSHNLRDVFSVCDRIAVLRHGAVVGVWRAQETNPDEIVVAMAHGGDRDSGDGDGNGVGNGVGDGRDNPGNPATNG